MFRKSGSVTMSIEWDETQSAYLVRLSRPGDAHAGEPAEVRARVYIDTQKRDDSVETIDLVAINAISFAAEVDKDWMYAAKWDTEGKTAMPYVIERVS